MERNGNFRKSIFALLVILSVGLFSNIVVSAEQSHCLPIWDHVPIIKDEKLKRIDYAPGDTFTLAAKYKYKSSCKNYVTAVFTWRALINGRATNDILFDDPHDPNTIARVENPSPGNYTIEGSLRFIDNFNDQSSPAEVYVNIVNKPPPPNILLTYGSLTKRQFNVGTETSDVHDGNNFLAGCLFVLTDVHGNIVDREVENTSFGKIMPKASLSVKGPDVYIITASCVDSHGSSGRVVDYINISAAITKQNSPVIVVDEKKNCVVGNCSIDYYINPFEKSLNVTIQETSSGSSVIRCDDQAQICRLNDVKPGIHIFKIVASYLVSKDSKGFHYSNPSEATVTVYVSQTDSQQVVPSQTVTPQQAMLKPTVAITAKVAQTATPCLPEYGCKESPGIGFSAVIFVIVILSLRKIRKIK